MFARKTESWIAIVLLLFLTTCSVFKILLPDQTHLNKAPSKALLNMPVRSKAEIVSELKDIKEQIGQLEEIYGQSGTTGFKVYSADETGSLLNNYKQLRTGLEYLNRGYIIDVKDWEGYPLEKKGKAAYNSEEAFQVLTELEQVNLPSAFLADFRVYLLPSGVPEISGLGGAGFTMISPPEVKDNSIEQLRVTLLHELGHHLHSRFMPLLTAKSNPLWDNYLRIRGGEWQDSGKVNTVAWSNSSEETFAEDFRMLFGKNQPFYGDIKLGDPRANPEIALKLKKFILSLKSQSVSESIKSPWVPDGLQFWLDSQVYIFIGWSAIAVGMSIILSSVKTKTIALSSPFYHRLF